jgi:hypothetical protein
MHCKESHPYSSSVAVMLLEVIIVMVLLMWRTGNIPIGQTPTV